MAVTLPKIHQRIVRQVKSEPKKAVALAILCGAVLFMWSRIFLFRDGGPATANAFPAENPANPANGGLNTAHVSQSVKALQEWAKSPITLTRRNVFAINLDYFPRETTNIAPVMEGDGFWEHVAKSLTRRADQEKARRILVENLRQQAAKLSLQSTIMTNGEPKALVNGNLVQAGDTVEGFRVVSIESRRIIVEREGVKLEVVFNFR